MQSIYQSRPQIKSEREGGASGGGKEEGWVEWASRGMCNK